MGWKGFAGTMDLLNGLKTAMGIKAFCQATGFLMPRET